MGVIIRFLAGSLCFAGAFAYWYFLPYQFYIGLLGAASLWGPILANFTLLLITTILGFPITIVLGVLGFLIWFD